MKSVPSVNYQNCFYQFVLVLVGLSYLQCSVSLRLQPERYPQMLCRLVVLCVVCCLLEVEVEVGLLGCEAMKLELDEIEANKNVVDFKRADGTYAPKFVNCVWALHGDNVSTSRVNDVIDHVLE